MEIYSNVSNIGECMWLHIMINHTQKFCGVGSIVSPTIIYEDNVVCATHAHQGRAACIYGYSVEYPLFLAQYVTYICIQKIENDISK
jgi:hypothetical protein